MRIPIHALGAVHEELEAVRRTITSRAHDLFRRRGGQAGRALDDWLCAERETIWRPAVELRETDGTLTVRVATAGVAAKDLDLRVGGRDVTLTAPIHHTHEAPGTTVHVCEFARGPLRLTLRLPRRVRPDAASAEYRDGLLSLTMPIDQSGPRHIDVTAEASSGPADAQALDPEC